MKKLRNTLCALLIGATGLVGCGKDNRGDEYVQPFNLELRDGVESIIDKYVEELKDKHYASLDRNHPFSKDIKFEVKTFGGFSISKKTKEGYNIEFEIDSSRKGLSLYGRYGSPKRDNVLIYKKRFSVTGITNFNGNYCVNSCPGRDIKEAGKVWKKWAKELRLMDHSDYHRWRMKKGFHKSKFLNGWQL